MVDLVFAVAFAACLVGLLVITRSPAASAVLVAAGIGGSGVLVQFAGKFIEITYGVLQWWLLATLALLLVIALVIRRRRGLRAATRTEWLLVLVPSVAIALMFLASRALAPGSPGPLTGVGYLISRTSAEDNAKWLNAAAQLAAGHPVDSWPNVGGPLLLLLTLAATLIASVSTLLYGGVNEVAVSSGTLILGEMLLIVIAPFALAPLVEARFRRRPDDRAAAIPWPLLLLSIVILASAVTLLLNFGHLTLQFTMLCLTLWIAAFVSWRSRTALILTTFAVIFTAEVWFPLSVVSLGLIVAVGVASVIALVKRREPRLAGAVLAGTVVTLMLMEEFLRSSISYSLGIGAGEAVAMGGGGPRGVFAIAVPSLPLFASPGGTEVVSALLAALTVLSVLGALVLLRDGGSRRAALRLAPIGVLVGFTLLVTLADYWSVGKGPGYASNKLTFAVAIPALVATLPLALLLLDRGTRSMTALRWGAVAAIVMLLVIDTFLPRALIQFKPALWPTTNAEPQPYWWPAEVRPTAQQALASNPIGCVYLPPGAERPSVLTDGQKAYSCTRLLTGVAGQDVPAAAVVQWTLDEWLSNESQWDHYQQYFTMMSPEARARQLILLNDKDEVVGLASLQSLMDRYPATADPASG